MLGRKLATPELLFLSLAGHLCIEVVDEIQQPVLDRAAAAWRVNKDGFDRLGEDGIETANAHVQVGKL